MNSMGHKPDILVMADDMTGAAEIGGTAFQYGLTVRIRIFPQKGGSSAGGVTILDTGSRGLATDQAYQVISERISGFDPALYEMVFKKVDSILRGPVIPEIDALLANTDFDRVLMVPANPSRKRIIRGGNLYIDGIPLHRTSFRKDPLHPRLSSGISELLGDERGVVTGNDPAVLKAGKIYVPDIGSEGDISALLAQTDLSRTLMAGGSDFFRAILSCRMGLKPVQRPAPPQKTTHQHFIMGSLSENSINTAHRLTDTGYEPVELPSGAILEESLFSEWTAMIVRLIGKGKNLVIRGPVERVTDPEVSGKIAGKIALAAKVVAQRALPGTHLCVDGGETASAFIRSMDWDHLRVRQVHEAGVVSLQPEGTDLVLTVKPGSYRWPESLMKTIKFTQ